MTVTYTDERFGDTFVIDTDTAGVVYGIVRYVEQLGRDPIYYDTVEELPRRVQEPIEELILLKCNKTSQQS